MQSFTTPYKDKILVLYHDNKHFHHCFELDDDKKEVAVFVDDELQRFCMDATELYLKDRMDEFRYPEMDETDDKLDTI